MKLENGDRGREARRTQAMKPPRNDRRCGHVAAYRGLGRRPAGRQWGLERACRRIGGSVRACLDRDLAGSLPARQPSQSQPLEIGRQAALRRPYPNNPLEKPLEVCFSDYKKN